MLRSTEHKGPRVLGVGGGVASGKSTVVTFFREQGIPVLSLDDLARELSEKGGPLWKSIVCAFGRVFLDERGMLRRRKLARVAFRNWRMLFLLNSLAHPLLFWKARRYCCRMGTEVVVVEGAVLFEAGFCPVLWKLLFVDAPWNLRLERLRARGLKESEIELYMKGQRFLPSLKRRASRVLHNESSFESLQCELFSLLRDWSLLEIENRESGFL